MVLNHLAAILLFSGPLFYIGLWMVVDPASIAALPELLLRLPRRLMRRLVGAPGPLHEPALAEISPTVRLGLRLAGLVLLLFAVAV